MAARLAYDARPLVMAIINRTRDSSYTKDSMFAFQDALAAVESAVAEGADVIDIGAIASSHQVEVVEAGEEAQRIVPLVQAIRERYPNVLISIDTFRAEVAERACEAGADLINDMWGSDLGMIDVAARYSVGLVCTHTGGLKHGESPRAVQYQDVVVEVAASLMAKASRAAEAGVAAEAIFIDPAHDFGKGTLHGLELLRRLDELVSLGWPVMLAVSRKYFLYETLGIPQDRLGPGSLAAAVVGARAGARMFRVHDVAQTRQAVDVVASIMGTRSTAVTNRWAD
ncbi:dihydropteroate synthase [Streptomyces cinereoruber]|uniref:dihydropteroate synthase n=1 Tax=Streptomyces cinereoruber TaxID=67260 RepID=UPI00363506CD